MAEVRKIRRALISVFDKTGIVDFARALHEEFGVEIISTGGTAKALKEAGIPVTMVEEVTGFPEMMDGRVKTLHPRIHAGILADRDNPEHMRQLEEQGIEPIDMVVVNLYPFEKTIAQPDCTFEQAIEMIDIGGPCLLRAAAKNHRHVLVLHNPNDWNNVLVWLREDALSEDGWKSVRQDHASSTFRLVSAYNASITDYLLRNDPVEPISFHAMLMIGWAEPRYGENPHQGANVLRPGPPCVTPEPHLFSINPILKNASVELSFNNYADASAALELCAELTRAGSAKFYFAKNVQASTDSTKCNFGVPGSEDSTKCNFGVPDSEGSTKCNFGVSDEGKRSVAHRKSLAPISDELNYRRKLPHWQVCGASYFVTFSSSIGTLSNTERDIVMKALHFWDGKRLDLHAAVVMCDHVHMLFTPRRLTDDSKERFNVTTLLQSIKANSARAINKQRNRTGQVWTRESYDRWMRDENEFIEKWEYIANNPVKEGLATTPDAYLWWYGSDTPGGFDDAPPRNEKSGGVSDIADEPPDEVELRTTPAAVSEVKLRTTMVGTCEDSLPQTCEENLRSTAVCFIKHTNACGSAIDVDPVEAYRRAYLGDPNAAMGGILAVNFVVDAEFASAVMETYQRWGKPLKEAGEPFAPGAFFVEVWLAPRFTEDAVAIIRGEYAAETAKPEPGESVIETPPQKAWGKRVRLLDVGDMSVEPDAGEMDIKRIAGGVLMQDRDLVGLNEEDWKVVTERQPTEAELNDLRLAWLVCKHTKSNAITICKDGALLGNGAGQMSRVMSCRIATWLAKENGHADDLQGSAAASDAFFPFRDGPDILADAGVTAIIQPGGSKRDEDTIAACNERGIAMVCTGMRHFKH